MAHSTTPESPIPFKGNTREYKRIWYQRNKERIRASMTEEQREAKRERDRKYYLRNKKKVCEYQKAHRAKNGGRQAAQKREYRSRDAERWKLYYREYNAKNAQRRQETSRNYYRKNRDRILKKVRQYEAAFQDTVRQRKADYQRRNSAAINKYKAAWVKARESRDPAYALLRRVGSRVAAAVATAKARKSRKTIRLLGCSPYALTMHIESMFRDGMTWANRSEWHLDHVIPLAAFDLHDSQQQAKAFHYSNLQPLWARENMSKGARLPDGSNARGRRYKTRWD